MTTLIAYFAAALLMLGLLLLVAPGLLLDYFRVKVEATGIRIVAVSLRVILGVILLLLADESRFPFIITLLGTFSLVSGIVLAFLPRHAFIYLINRFTGMNAMASRAVGLGALALSWFLVYALL